MVINIGRFFVMVVKLTLYSCINLNTDFLCYITVGGGSALLRGGGV